EFLGKVLDASRQTNFQRQTLIDEIQSIGGPNRGSIFDEIVKTEAEVRTRENEIQLMVDDPSVELAVVMRANAEHSELKAYLKGLKFQRSQQNTVSAPATMTGAPVNAS